MLLHVCCRKKLDFSLKAVLKWYFYFCRLMTILMYDEFFLKDSEEKVLTQRNALFTFAVCVRAQLLLAFLAGTGHVVPDLS